MSRALFTPLTPARFVLFFSILQSKFAAEHAERNISRASTKAKQEKFCAENYKVLRKMMIQINIKKEKLLAG